MYELPLTASHGARRPAREGLNILDFNIRRTARCCNYCTKAWLTGPHLSNTRRARPNRPHREATRARRSQSPASLDQIFALIDTDGSGSIDIGKLQAALTKVGKDTTVIGVLLSNVMLCYVMLCSRVFVCLLFLLGVANTAGLHKLLEGRPPRGWL